MPARNALKIQVADAYYHIYARGNNKQPIFRSEDDFDYFVYLINRYLSNKEVLNDYHRVYPNFNNKVILLAFCLMPNHFHLLIYQNEVPFLEKFMQSLMTSYGKYFNLKYKQSGPVFESRYKAVLVESESYLLHISRYIHLNPRTWKGYKYSSLKYYKGDDAPNWIDTSKILELFNNPKEYLNFVSEYKQMRDSLKDLKHALAGK